MTHEELLGRIAMNPAVCGGKPCIRGHRIWVSLILDLLASGMTVDQSWRSTPSSNRKTSVPVSLMARR